MALFTELQKGDRVMLENCRHEQFRGMTGTVRRTIKSRMVVEVQLDNGKLYDSLAGFLRVMEALDGLAPRSVDEKTIAERKWQTGLKPAKPQLPADVGLFGDEHLQLDLVEMLNDDPE